MSVRIQLLDHTMKRVVRYLSSIAEAETEVDCGRARWLNRGSREQAVVQHAFSKRKRRAVQRVWSPAPSLTVSPAVVEQAADGNVEAQKIVVAYGETLPRYEEMFR
jgi:hypothetical protein